MAVWISLFSDFTSEALLFEALIIFVLSGLYAAFWILKKRRFGVVENTMPSGPVKAYLNELIFNAEQLRAQIFGLLGHPSHNAQGTLSHTHTQSWSVGTISAGSPELTKKLAELEAQLSEQNKAMEQVSSTKTQLENELAEMKKGASSAGDSNTNELNEKIKLLEARLSEYSVIEDDLANLKRFQQENAQLKAQLASSGAGAPTAATAVPTSEPTAQAAAAAPDAAPAEPVEEAPAPIEEPSVPEPDVVPAAATPVTAAEPQIASGAAPTAPDAAGANKAEEDLVAEFEKMLKN